MVVAPAAAGTGVTFHRVDAAPTSRPIPARLDFVCGTQYCTRLANEDGLSVSTVEHLMAALAGCGVTDARISLDGPEVPIMDGSAAVFVQAFVRAGIRDLGVPCEAIRVLAPVSARLGDRMARLVPAPRFEMEFSISYRDPAIGMQSKDLALTGSTIVSELSDSRTFACLSDVEMLHRRGFGRGGGLENAVVVDNGRILNAGGLRHADEFVRHKMLDAVGDLALAGAPIVGRYIGIKAGHELSNRLLRALFARPDCWEWCEPTPEQLPGGNLLPPSPAPADASIAV
jgi:UDP-3-O-[3-hydroxymyristoyl] N-acetylglucosamine deacetylase